MRHVYSLLLYLLSPAVFVYFLIRGAADRRWWRRWSERIGTFDATGHKRGILVHAASVGEVNAAVPLIRALKGRWPDYPVTVSCFTPTGSERINSLFGDSVHHVYAPLDLPGAVRRFLAGLQPHALIIIETEIWPNLFHVAQARDIPLLIANARLTERSAGTWRRFRGLAGQTLRCATLIAAQTGADRRRFVELGADRDRTRTCGNLKFDLTLPPDLRRRGREWRELWGRDRAVLVAGSTHGEDETALLEAFETVLKDFPDSLLVLVPRYPERFERVAERAKARALAVGQLSEKGAIDAGTQCLVVDRMGELLGFYAAADIAFLGGTLAPVGGHNPLEAAALGRPLIIGPHTDHIEELSASLVGVGAAVQVHDADSLAKAWTTLLAEPGRRVEMGRAARELVEAERGALERTLQIIEAMLD